MSGKPSGVLVAALAAAAIAAAIWLLLRDRRDDPGAAAGPTTDVPSLADRDRASAEDEQRTPESLRTPASSNAASVASIAHAEPPPEELWGRVVAKAEGTPIAGADVRLLHRDADEFWNLDLDYGEQVTELDRATSDADGRFRFEVARAREHRLVVHALGRATTTVTDCTGGSEVIVELARGAAVEGVVTCGGRPLSAAPVWIVVRGESVELGVGTTGSDGRFAFHHLPPRDVYLQVRSPNHAEKWESVQLTEGEVHRVDIEVSKGRALVGHVVDAETRLPVVGARVADSWTFKRSVVTDGDGSFELLGADEVAELYVRADGYCEATRVIQAADNREIEVALGRGGTVTGRLIDEDGRPAHDAYAAVAASFMIRPGYEHTDWMRARVAGDGTFVARGLRPDQLYWLYVRSAGFGARTYVLPRALEAGERIDVGDVVLRPAGGVEGRVIDEDGTPHSGESVSISGTNGDAKAWYTGAGDPRVVIQLAGRGVKTDALGHFRFTSLAAGSYSLQVRIAGRAEPVSRTVDVADGEILEDVELRVVEGGVIAGRLRCADGRAIGGERLMLSIGNAYAHVEADGSFRFSGLGNGQHDVSIDTAPSGFAMSPRRGVPAGTTDLELVLVPASTVSGRVVDADGQGTRGRVWVRWDPPLGGSRIHATDAAGRFAIPVPPDFRGSVHAAPAEGPLGRCEIEGVSAGRTDLELRLPPAGVPRGR